MSEQFNIKTAEFKRGYFMGYYKAIKNRKGKGWEEVRIGRNLFDYAFECKDCGAQIDGFVVSPRFCPYCGKEHG